MHRNLPGRQTQDMQSPVIKWLLDSTLHPLAGDAGPDRFGAARSRRRAREGCYRRRGARLLGLQAADGTWGGAAWNRGWDSTMHVLMLLRDMGLDPASEEACRAVDLVRDGSPGTVVDRGNATRNAFFDGEIEPCINGQVAAVGAYFGQDVRKARSTGCSTSNFPMAAGTARPPKARPDRHSTPRSACSKPCSSTNGPLGSAES